MTDTSASIVARRSSGSEDRRPSIAAGRDPHADASTLRGSRDSSPVSRSTEVEVAYQTLGKLSARRDNAILVCHALSGTAHVAGLQPETGRPGWWDFHVGPGKAIDTDKFFVICSNVLGGCDGTTGPISPRPDTGKPYGMEFPADHHPRHGDGAGKADRTLGDPQLLAVIGGSMGGMQALAWAVNLPGVASGSAFRLPPARRTTRCKSPLTKSDAAPS